MNTHQQSEVFLTKESIFTALMLLMEEKDYSKISITDIASKAGVSRMAYYRHFSSKEDILEQHLQDLFDAYKASVISRRNDIEHALTLFFMFFRSQKPMLYNIQKAQLERLLLKKFHAYIHHLLKYFDPAPLETETMLSYKIDFIAGGMFQLLMHWSKNGMLEADTQMGEYAGCLIQQILSSSFV